MATEKDTWGEYSKLVLNELQRLNENYENLRSDVDKRLNEMNQKLTEVKNIEGKVATHSGWIDKVNDVWSPSQMKEAKDEIYKQKNRMTAVFSVLAFLQILITIAIAVWGKLR